MRSNARKTCSCALVQFALWWGQVLIWSQAPSPPRRYLHNVRSQSTSFKTRTLHEQMLRNLPMDRMRDVHTPGRCPCLMRPLPCEAICRNATTRRSASNHASFSPLPCQCGGRWSAHGRQVAAMRRAPRSQSRRRTILPSSISSSGSPTTLPSLLLRTCHVPSIGTSWVVKPHQLLAPPCF
jgi:hypothetical protein